MAYFVKNQLVKNIVASPFCTVSFDESVVEYFRMSKWMFSFVIAGVDIVVSCWLKLVQVIIEPQCPKKVGSK